MLKMNAVIRKLFTYSFRSNSSARSLHVSPVTCLYAPAAIGLDEFLQTRKRIKDRFALLTDKFKSKMHNFVADPKSMIFTEDLKNIIHIAEASDIDLVVNMIKKFNSNKDRVRFGSFTFGPVIMRLFYFLDAPKEALKCFEDPVNEGFFDQFITYQVLLDLLYNNEMYEEMFKVFDKIQERRIHMTKYPANSVLLILTACYKQNTKKSFEYASKLMLDMVNEGKIPLRRATAIFAAYALKNNAPHIALESISVQRQNYYTIRNIKAMALAQLGRVDDALPVLRSVLEIDIPTEKDKHTFLEDTITAVKTAVQKSNNPDLTKEFERIESALIDRELIEKKSLDQILTAEITAPRKDSRTNFRNRANNQQRQV